MKNLFNILFFGVISCFGQQNSGKLLLLKVDIERDLQIDKKEFIFLVLEMNYDGSIMRGANTKNVFFDGFQDSDIISCLEKDSIEIATSYIDETYEHDNLYLNNYSKLVEKNTKKMHDLISLNIKSQLYKEKIKISYILMESNYCKGYSTERDSEIISIERDLILIIDELKFYPDFKLTGKGVYDVIKAIRFGNFIY